MAAWTTSDARDELGGGTSSRRRASSPPARSVVVEADRRDADVDATTDADADAVDDRKAAATPDKSSMINRMVIRLKLPVVAVLLLIAEVENMLQQIMVAVVSTHVSCQGMLCACGRGLQVSFDSLVRCAEKL